MQWCPSPSPRAGETKDGGMGGMRIMATIYIEIYSLGGDDERFWPKYAILNATTQLSDNQSVIAIRIIFAAHASRSALRYMPNRGATDGLSRRDTWPFEGRLGRYRNTKDA